jgi:hypothetical protein
MKYQSKQDLRQVPRGQPSRDIPLEGSINKICTHLGDTACTYSIERALPAYLGICSPTFDPSDKVLPTDVARCRHDCPIVQPYGNRVAMRPVKYCPDQFRFGLKDLRNQVIWRWDYLQRTR